jgi:hypothetical protein
VIPLLCPVKCISQLGVLLSQIRACLSADGRTVRAHKDGADIKTGLRSQLARNSQLRLVNNYNLFCSKLMVRIYF